MKAVLAAAITLAAAAGVLVVVGFGGRTAAGGDGAAGKQLIASFGCGGCHSIAGVQGADGKVGPSLRGLDRRRTIAGTLVNTPENLAAWIDDPKAVNPRTLMPDLGVTRAQAQEIAAYLDSH